MTETTAAAAPGSDAKVRRKDGDLILTGRGRYLDDIELPNMHHAALLRSTHAHARILGIDTSRALSASGVRAVLTGEDARRVAGVIQHVYDPANVGGNTTDYYCLAVDKVRYVGEPVAAVVADTLANAEAAVDAIDVDYEVLPTVVDADDALRDDAPLLFEEWGSNVIVRLPFAEGDAAGALADAPHVIEDELRIQRYQTAPMETRGYAASWEPDGRLTMYASTQSPHLVRTTLAAVLDMDESRIRVIAPRVGGGFGHKFHGFHEETIVCLLSRMVGAPVKYLEPRPHSLIIGAREFTHRFAVGFDDEGHILAIRNRVIGNVGSLTGLGGWAMTFPAGLSFPGGYKVKHYDVESVAVVTNKAPWSGARGYGKESAGLALERMIDLVAQRLSLDPAEVRRRNFIPPDEFPYWTAAMHIDSGNYEGALDKVLALSNYRERRAEQEAARRAGRLVGVGVAFELTPEGGDYVNSNFRGFDTTTVRVSPTGGITVLTGVTSPGTGNETSIALLVARELGVQIERVDVHQGDTDLCPFGFGNWSSRSLTTGGGAAVLAARDIKERMASAAGELLETDPARLVFADGEIRVEEDGGERLPFEHVARQLYQRLFTSGPHDKGPLESTRTDGPTNVHNVPDEKGRMSAYPTFPYSTHVCVVEVDKETGMVTVLDYAAVHDCGTVISPTFVESQFYGGVAMGIGGALMEDLPYGPDGQPLASHFKTYLLPRASDVPTIKLGHQETPSPFTTLGTKGAGESGVGGAISCVANAVNDALSPLGVRIHTMPLSPPNVLRAIRSGVSS